MIDIGFEAQVNLLNLLQEMGADVLVIDSNTILKNPEQELRKLCKNTGIPFYNEMLSWEKGARPEDGIWAKYWYKNVHNSNGFQPYVAKNVELENRLIPLYDASMFFYEKLIASSKV